MKIAIIGALPLALMLVHFEAAPAGAAGKGKMSESDRISYSIGYQIGSDLKRLNRQVDPEALRQGLQDAHGEKAALEKAEMLAAIRDLQAGILSAQMAEAVKAPPNAREARAEDRDQGHKFMAANSTKEGVVVRPSGLQYKILKEGDGRHPGPEDTVVVNYRATTLDGSEFYNTARKGKPVEVKLANTIPGLREGLALMKKGGRWQLFIPENLAYGEQGPLADKTVIFDLELVAIK